MVIFSDRLKMKSEIDSFQLGCKSSPHRWARPRTLWGSCGTRGASLCAASAAAGKPVEPELLSLFFFVFFLGGVGAVFNCSGSQCQFLQFYSQSYVAVLVIVPCWTVEVPSPRNLLKELLARRVTPFFRCNMKGFFPEYKEKHWSIHSFWSVHFWPL